MKLTSQLWQMKSSVIEETSSTACTSSGGFWYIYNIHIMVTHELLWLFENAGFWGLRLQQCTTSNDLQYDEMWHTMKCYIDGSTMLNVHFNRQYFYLKIVPNFAVNFPSSNVHWQGWIYLERLWLLILAMG